jgi:exodeoxyribonuclease VII large subunit
MWRSIVHKHAQLPDDGQEVAVIAVVRVYRRGGYYQLDVQRLQSMGKGLIYEEFERMKKKLQKEGLFDAARKKALPEEVARVGLVTSARGAAVRDMIKNIHARAPWVEIVICDVAVQGDEAPSSIGSGIRMCNEYNRLDCIITGRGGGSIEDLWAFNEEEVARAISESHIPVISAVGHEVDVTIADLVADVRAETPSAAAVRLVKDSRELGSRFSSTASRFIRSFLNARNVFSQRYRTLHHRMRMAAPVYMIKEQRQRMDEESERLVYAMRRFMAATRERVQQRGRQLDALSPLKVLERGFSVVRTSGKETVRDARMLCIGEKLDIRLYRGSAEATVDSVTTDE